MSWHYLQGQEVESWEENSLDGAPSALLSMMPLPEESYCNGNAMAACHASPSGTMCEPLTGSRGECEWMSSLVDSHAPTSARRTLQKQAWMAKRADSGEKWPESFARWNLNGSLWRTSQQSLFGGWIEFSGTWPQWGMMLHGECWEVKMSVSRCGGTECGLWRPATSGDSVGRGYHGKLSGNHWPALPGQICQYLGLPIQCPETGKIAPWVFEVLMGWPEGWTESAPLETDSLREWRRLHGKF